LLNFIKSKVNKLLTEANRINKCKGAYTWSTADEMDYGTT
jgi:hypothetical protein